MFLRIRKHLKRSALLRSRKRQSTQRNAQNIPPLLSLPREIRDIIIELVISSVREAPPDTAAAEPRAPSQTSTPWKPSSFGRTQVRFEQPTYISNSAPLLLVNHQIFSETAAALTRLSVPYELDVILYKERELWPTWLSVPVLSKQLDRVNVTFRTLGGEELPPKWSSGWMQGNGAPPWLSWCFYSLLEFVLRRGPVSHASTSGDKEVSIKMLDLNFVGKNDKEEIPGEILLPVTERWKYTRYHSQSTPHEDEPVQEKILRPEWLAGWLIDYFCHLLAMGYHTAEYGRILHGRIGTIRFSVNGELKTSINIGAVLQGLEREDYATTFGNLPRAQRISTFREWKRDAIRRREELGFPLLDDGDET